jgi:hypothetical protein
MQLNNGNNEIEMVQEHQYLMLHAMIVAKSTHRKTYPYRCSFLRNSFLESLAGLSVDNNRVVKLVLVPFGLFTRCSCMPGTTKAHPT